MTPELDERIGALLLQSEAYLRAGNYRKALSMAQEVIGLDPERVAGYLVAAQAHAALGRFGAAVTLCERALALAPGHHYIHYLLAWIDRACGRYRPAEEHIRRALEAAPGHADYWEELAHLCYAQRDLDGARRFAQRTLEVDPENASALNLLAQVAPGDTPERAAEKLQLHLRALEADPEDPRILNDVGALYLERRDYAKAEDFMRRALALRPHAAAFRRNLYAALKHRSRLYRVLRWPDDACARLAFALGRRGWLLLPLALLPFLLPLALLPFAAIWWMPALTALVYMFIAALLPAAAFFLWCFFVWPLIKFYEFLTISDIRATAGDVGARRGGPLGMYGWPFRVRFALFGLGLCCLGVFLVVSLANAWTRLYALAVVIIVGFLGCGLYAVRRVSDAFEGQVHRWESHRRERRFRLLEETKRS